MQVLEFKVVHTGEFTGRNDEDLGTLGILRAVIIIAALAASY